MFNISTSFCSLVPKLSLWKVLISLLQKEGEVFEPSVNSSLLSISGVLHLKPLSHPSFRFDFSDTMTHSRDLGSKVASKLVIHT